MKRVGLLAVAVVLAGCGSSSSFGSPSVAQAKMLMTDYLRSKHLDYRWVACLHTGRTFKGADIVRCNVNFGIDPHVEAYCIVLHKGKLYSDHNDPKVPCQRDNRAPPATIVTS